jgi:poly(3-hydroxybutyrate) depolymerase
VPTAIDTYRRILLLDTISSSVSMGTGVSCQSYTTPQSWLNNDTLVQNPVPPYGDLKVWRSALASAQILFCPIAGMGHTWPAQPPKYDINQCDLSCDTKTCSATDQQLYNTYCVPYKNAVGALSSAIDANTEIWKFLSAHPMQ